MSSSIFCCKYKCVATPIIKEWNLKELCSKDISAEMVFLPEISLSYIFNISVSRKHSTWDLKKTIIPEVSVLKSCLLAY